MNIIILALGSWFLLVLTLCVGIILGYMLKPREQVTQQSPSPSTSIPGDSSTKSGAVKRPDISVMERRLNPRLKATEDEMLKTFQELIK